MPRIPKAIISEVAAAMSRMRKTHSGGNPSILRPCPHCQEQFNGREMRAHLPQCQANPNRRKKEPAAPVKNKGCTGAPAKTKRKQI
jgi:hypothetical protein